MYFGKIVLYVYMKKWVLVAMTATTRVMTFCGFVMVSLTWALGTFVWSSSWKESNSAWYAFHTWHVCNETNPLFMAI